VAYPLNNLALLYQELERYGEAESLYRRALTIREQLLGADHPDTQAVRRSYNALLRKLEADRTQSRAFSS
jgi:hypothetical protein